MSILSPPSTVSVVNIKTGIETLYPGSRVALDLIKNTTVHAHKTTYPSKRTLRLSSDPRLCILVENMNAKTRHIVRAHMLLTKGQSNDQRTSETCCIRYHGKYLYYLYANVVSMSFWIFKKYPFYVYAGERLSREPPDPPRRRDRATPAPHGSPRC